MEVDVRVAVDDGDEVESVDENVDENVVVDDLGRYFVTMPSMRTTSKADPGTVFSMLRSSSFQRESGAPVMY